MEALQSFTLCPSNGFSTNNKENGPSSVPSFLQDKNRNIFRPILQENAFSEVTRVIRASPFEAVVHKRNLPRSGTISPLNFEEYQAWKAGCKREAPLNHISLPQSAEKQMDSSNDSVRIVGDLPVPSWPLRGENENDSWKEKFLRSEIARTQLSTNLMTLLEENRKLRIKMMSLEASLVREQNRSSKHEEFFRSQRFSDPSNKSIDKSESNPTVPVPQADSPGRKEDSPVSILKNQVSQNHNLKRRSTSRKSEGKSCYPEKETKESPLSKTLKDGSPMCERETNYQNGGSSNSCSTTPVSDSKAVKSLEGDCNVTEHGCSKILFSPVLDASNFSGVISENEVNASCQEAANKEENDSSHIEFAPDRQEETCGTEDNILPNHSVYTEEDHASVLEDAPVCKQDASNGKRQVLVPSCENDENSLFSDKESNGCQINSRRGCRALPTSPDDMSVSAACDHVIPKLSSQVRMTRSRTKKTEITTKAEDRTCSNRALEVADGECSENTEKKETMSGKITTRRRAKKDRAERKIDTFDDDILCLSPIEKHPEDGGLYDVLSMSKNETKENGRTDKRKKNEVSLFDNFQAPALKRQRRRKR